MRAPLVIGCSVLLSVATASCMAPARPSLEDSRGVIVQWQCSGGTCEVTGSSASPPVCHALPDIDLFVLGSGAFAMLCGASVVGRTLELHEESCRPILCAQPSDCPQWDDRPYACDRGVCTSAHPPQRLDVVAACLANVDRPPTCLAAETDPATLAALENVEGACTETACTIPEACQP